MKTLLLGDALELLVDNRGKNPPFAMAGVPIVTAMSVRDGVLDLAESRFVSEQTWSEWMPTPLRKNDVLLTSEAPLGRVALVRTNEPILPTQRIFALRGKCGILDSRFLFYALQTKYLQTQLHGRATGTTVVGIRQPALRSVELKLPSIGEQLAIAEVLGALDDKIAANTALHHATDRLAKMHFVAAVSSCKEAELRTVESVMSLEYGMALPAVERRPGEVDVFGSGGIVGQHDESLNPGPGVVVGRKGTVGSVYWASRDFFPIDTTYYVHPRGDAASLVFCYFALQSLDLGEANSDSAVPGLNRNFAYSQRVSVPCATHMEQFTAAATGLFDLKTQYGLESEVLANLRDTLLQQLMSGRLRVKDAEKHVEAVV